MAISTLPTPPNRADPVNFAVRGDALLGALPVFVAEANALQVDVNAKQQATSDAAVAGAESAAAALINKNASGISAAEALANRNTAVLSDAAALASKNAAAISATLSTNSANLAAANLLAQLTAIKTQTEMARDQAIAGLGAADQSANLVTLAAGIQGAMDLIAIALAFPVTTPEVDLILTGLNAALDLAGVAARQVGGGSVQLAAGSTLEPSLWTAGDRNTGLSFPAADAIAIITSGLERLRVDASGYLGLGTNAPSGMLDVADNKLRVRSARTPASAAAAGNAGEICWDSAYVYVGQIDATLAALDASSKSAERIIADAINAGSDKTAGGLHAVIAALTGQAIPAFMLGGNHAGGLRLVGENGPELEVTGPARIFNAAQTRGMLSNGGGGSSTGNTARLEALVERQNQELIAMRAELRAIASTNAKMARLADRVYVEGALVRTDVDMPLTVTS